MRRIIGFITALIATVQLAQANEYILDTAHSSVGFSVKHMMITNVKGSFAEFDGDLEFDPQSKTFTKISATIDAASVDTGIKKRDDHLRSPDFFEVKKFPNITFEMTSATPDSVTGNLTIRGVTKKVVLNKTFNGMIKDFQGNNRIGLALEGQINRKDFGLTWNKLLEAGGVAVDENVKLIVDIQAIEM